MEPCQISDHDYMIISRLYDYIKTYVRSQILLSLDIPESAIMQVGKSSFVAESPNLPIVSIVHSQKERK